MPLVLVVLHAVLPHIETDLPGIHNEGFLTLHELVHGVSRRPEFAEGRFVVSIRPVGSTGRPTCRSSGAPSRGGRTEGAEDPPDGTGRYSGDVLHGHGMERFLYRLSQLPGGGRFVLKGGLMLMAWRSASVWWPC